MPRSRSIAIQSERARRRSPRALTSPASWIAPPNSSNFSVRVVLPASGCEMIAKPRWRDIKSPLQRPPLCARHYPDYLNGIGADATDNNPGCAADD